MLLFLSSATECFLCLCRRCSARIKITDKSSFNLAKLRKCMQADSQRGAATGHRFYSNQEFSAGSRRRRGRAVKGKKAVSGVETSEGPERNQTNHRGRFAADSPLPRLSHPSLRGQSRCCKISSATLAKAPLPSAGGTGGSGGWTRGSSDATPLVDDAGMTLNSARTPVSLAVGRTERI